MRAYPRPPVPAGHVEPVPRRVRAVKDGATAVDTLAARYVWEWPMYPQFYVPEDDVRAGVFDAADLTRSADPALAGTVKVAWDAADAWFEEEEEVFVHPRSPYVRVDALRSSRHVRVELDGVLLAESHAPVAVFETGLPTRWYLERTAVRWEHLVPSDTRTACPYKGRTTGYWSVRTGDTVHPDLAWSYDFTTAPLLPVAGLVAFLDEQVDVTLDGVARPRPRSPFS